MALPALRFAAGALALAVPAVAATAPLPPMARLTYVERTVEHRTSGLWRAAREGEAVRIGEQVRTADGAMLHLDFPWMAVTLSPSSTLEFPDAPLLQGLLTQGRVALRAERREILKLVTSEAEVRGQGRVVVRRLNKDTLVSNLSGRFSVEGGASVVTVPAGQGAVVHAGQAPTLTPLPPPPGGLVPGADPAYVPEGSPIHLQWNGQAASYHVEVLAIGSETVLVERDVDGPGVDLAIRWPGAFRWRVSSRDARGLEGPPSPDGFFCVND
jgi:hypothetical protein